MRLAKLAVFVFLLAVSSIYVQAQAVQPQTNPSTASAEPKKIIEYNLPPGKLEKSHALYLQSIRFQVVDTVYGFLILLGILYFGVAARFRNIAERRSQKKWL